MQTFLPYADFGKAASCLDRSRLGKQRVECLEILVTISGKKPDWMSDKWFARCMQHENHPAVKMWRGFEAQLCLYAAATCLEWIRRGFKDTCSAKISEIQVANNWFRYTVQPIWLGEETFHASHRSNLLRKNQNFYARYRWSEPPTLSYVWPGGRR